MKYTKLSISIILSSLALTPCFAGNTYKNFYINIKSDGSCSKTLGLSRVEITGGIINVDKKFNNGVRIDAKELDDNFFRMAFPSCASAEAGEDRGYIRFTLGDDAGLYGSVGYVSIVCGKFDGLRVNTIVNGPLVSTIHWGDKLEPINNIEFTIKGCPGP